MNIFSAKKKSFIAIRSQTRSSKIQRTGYYAAGCLSNLVIYPIINCNANFKACNFKTLWLSHCFAFLYFSKNHTLLIHRCSTHSVFPISEPPLVRGIIKSVKKKIPFVHYLLKNYRRRKKSVN